MVREVLDWTLHIVIAIAIGLFIVKFIGQITIVEGNSMLPTLQDKNALIVEKLTQRFGNLKQGDIVTLYVPEYLNRGYVEDGYGLYAWLRKIIYPPRSIIIKRVIGVEGDTVEVRDGKVYVNGNQLKESYINGSTTLQVNPKFNKVVVPNGQIYVLGDNRLPQASEDSRDIGPLDISKVRGKAIFRFFPFDKIGTISK